MADKPLSEDKLAEDTLNEEASRENPQEKGKQDKPAPEQAGDAAAAETASAESGSGDDAAARLAAAEARAEEFHEQYLRTAAEMENLRKRAARDIEQARKFALEKFIVELLPVIDALEMGLNAAEDAKDQAGALLEGTEMTLKQFQQVMEKFGVEAIVPRGEEFNPEFHEAMAMQPSSEQAPNTILTVVQKGYVLNGRVVRPARVLVAKDPEE